jgi:hypothetical protein
MAYVLGVSTDADASRAISVALGSLIGRRRSGYPAHVI